MKKLLGAALIAGSLLIHGCKEDKKTNTFNTHVPDLHAVLSMKIQDSDAKEFKAYENVMDEYYLGTNYMSKDPSLA